MLLKNVLLFLLFTPAVLLAGEPSKGTVVLISGVSGWLVLSSGFILLREIKRGRNRDK